MLPLRYRCNDTALLRPRALPDARPRGHRRSDGRGFRAMEGGRCRMPWSARVVLARPVAWCWMGPARRHGSAEGLLVDAAANAPATASRADGRRRQWLVRAPGQ